MKPYLFILISFLLSFNLFSQNIESITNERWADNSWQTHTRELHDYDTNNYLTTIYYQTWDKQSSSWLYQNQSIYINNPNGLVYQRVSRKWEFNTWNNIQRITYSYSASEKIIDAVLEQWYLNKWQNYNRVSNTYDGSDFLTFSIYEDWDKASSSWLIKGKNTYINNSNGFLLECISQTWDDILNQWKNSARYKYTYTSSEKLMTEITEYWWDSLFTPTFKDSNIYDVNEYLIKKLTQIKGISYWENNYQSNYSNNAKGTVQQIIYQKWDNTINIWEDHYRSTYTYYANSWVNDLSTTKISIYPNPSRDYIKIESSTKGASTYNIADLLGKLIMHGDFLDRSNIIDISSLNNGIYILEFRIDNEKYTSRFGKQ